jgi:purine nucleoside phosphorylase
MGADADPIPTPGHVAGKWMSADRDQAGGRVLVPMSNGQFKQMARALYNRNAAVWDAKQVHCATVEAMGAAGATAEQILQYDHTAGWPETT